MNIPEIIKQFDSYISTPDVIICLAGSLVLGGWLLKTSFGRKALANSLPRQNNMHPFVPFIALFIWFGAVSLAISITKKLLPDLPDWQNAFLDNFILCIGAIIATIVIIFLARADFVLRLKGFGLDARTIYKDFFAALLNLLSVWPLVMAMIILTLFLGKLIWGPDFRLRQHGELELITKHSQLSVRVLIIVTVVAVVPAFEEMLFRGLLQTMLRTFLSKPWPSIALSSAIFAMVHQDREHWPALFALSMCLGYAYEKSGSLFRPIFIHSFFNAVGVIAALNQ